MGPRRGADMVPQEPQPAGLIFNEPLSWRAGKPIPTGELLRRLDTLSNELREMDQEDTDKELFTKLAKELAGQNLLQHKDKGVRAFTACCLVDILKLCAPDAPFTATQLKDIFTLFVTSILPALSDPSNAYNTQHKYVLVSLEEVKSIVLITDIPTSEVLTIHLFVNFFDIISGSSKTSTGEQISKDIEYHMTQMLVTLVDEYANLPADAVDTIVAQFLRAANPPGPSKKKGDAKVDDNQSTLLPKEVPEAYNMAQTICNMLPEKMARYISQYFNDVITDVSTTNGTKSNGHRRMSDAADSDDEAAPTGPTEADMGELRKAHRLLRELWRASPLVLQNVIPQLEAELSAENVQLRLLATETLGDIISGIGAAGPPPPPTMDPSAYPPAKLEDYPSTPVSSSVLTTPLSPQSFSEAHPGVYRSFVARKNDKSSIIRSAWTTAVGWILITSAGGIGLKSEDLNILVKSLGEKLNDGDEKVRIAAIRVIEGFSFRDVMEKLAPNGGVSKAGSVLSTLADRARDRKHAVRSEGMTVLGRLWGVAAGEIAEGNEAVTAALGSIPSRIFNAFFTNDKEIHVLMDHVMFEQLLPLGYPPIKTKGSKLANGNSQSQSTASEPFDADKIRTERILLLVQSLDSKSKKGFLAMQSRQLPFATIVTKFIDQCKEFNGGVMDENAKEIKKNLDRLINYMCDFLPDPVRTSIDLHKYAKLHNRRSYELLRFAMALESDFKTVHKAIKEFSKIIEAAPGAPAGILETLSPVIYRCSSLVYNRSHLPAILQFARSDNKGLGSTAHEIMNEISEKNPQIFTANIKDLCKSLEDEAPSKTKVNDIGTVETLKACAVFARSRPKEIPHDRKFIQALINFALYGTPAKAAKYAISILIAATDRKEMHVKDLLEKTTADWEFGKNHFLTKLAAISQLSLLEPKIAGDVSDEILDITTTQLLLKVRTEIKDSDHSWQDDAELDEECQAKCWAMKALVNRLRATEEPEKAKNLSVPVFKLLNTLIFKEGELSKSNATPKHHKSRLRLLAAQLMLKLCTRKIFDELLSPIAFNRLSFVAQDMNANVRRGFIEKLQKYLVKNKLPPRFYTIIFLTAFEPEVDFHNSIITWIRSRAKVLAKSHTMESIFPRLISLLAHHPDYSPEPDELPDHARYIVYYIKAIASEDNLALIYKYAQRVKSVQDGINLSESDNLYILSDLAQTLIRKWEEKKGWSMQTWPVKVNLPAGLFKALPSHDKAQEIAERTYLPDSIDSKLDDLVRDAEKKKQPKRKATDGDSHPTAKKQKSESKPRPTKSAAIRKERPVKSSKAPKPKREKSTDFSTPAASSVNRRRSGREASARKSYADRDDSDDDDEMLKGVAKWDYFDKNNNPIQPAPEDEAESFETAEEKAEDKPQTPELEAEDPASEMDVDEPEPKEEPAPPKSNGKTTAKPKAKQSEPTLSPKAARSKPTKTKQKAVSKEVERPAVKSPVTKTRVTKVKQKAVSEEVKSPAAKPKSPVVKTKAPLKVSMPKAKAKGKKDIYDMDESDS